MVAATEEDTDVATFSDVLSLGVIQPLFAFLFITILAVGFSRAVNLPHKWMGWAFGILFGLITFLSPTVTGLVTYMVPWFAIIMFFVALIFMIIKYLAEDAGPGGGQYKGTYFVVGIVIVIFLLIGAVGYIRDRALTGQKNPGMQPALLVFNPTVIGAIIVFAMAAFGIALLTTSSH